MPAVKITATMVRENESDLKSTLEFVATVDSSGKIKRDNRVYGLITGYCLGKQTLPGVYPFFSKLVTAADILDIDWGMDYPDFDSTLDILNRELKVGDKIIHKEKTTERQEYVYKIDLIDYFE